MPDIVDPQTRSRMMAGIKNKNTKPEMVIRKGLHRKGFRYRLHDASLPGKPDIIFSRRKAVIMVNGCFWHYHNCHLFKWPSTRTQWWQAKISRNREKDIETRTLLAQKGWRILTIWECALKGKTKLPINEVIEKAAFWLDNSTNSIEIQGEHNGIS